MSRVNRRTLILHSASAVIASTVVETAVAREPQRRNQVPSRELRALIEAHRATYAAFGKAVHERAVAAATVPRLAGLKKKRWWLSAPIPLSAKPIGGSRQSIY